MKIRIGILCTILAGSLVWGQVAVAPAGSGTSESPYEITSLGNLYWIAASTSNWDKHYIQTADIDASATESWFSGAGWTPIGNNTVAFTGSYDGDGFSITELYINRPSDTYYGGMGLFGTATGATIKNIELFDCTVTGHWYVGVLLGKANATYIEYCGSSGNVYGLASVGGLVGNHSSHSLMKYCYSEANVAKSLIGAEYGSRMGGLAGTNNQSSKISNSYAFGSVTGYQFIGGLTGENGTYSNYQDDTARVVNSYSTGYITGTLWTGGFVGLNYNSESHNTDCVVLNSFWDINTSGRSTSHAGTAKTTSEMKTTSTFTSAGWDFTTLWDRNDSFNSGYPFLIELMLYVPAVTTDSITNISTSTATCHSNVTDLGYRNLNQHGICWNTSENPTIDHSKTEQGATSSTGSFSSSLTSLTENTTYYVRSYAINDAGIVYGNQISFNTYAYAEIQSDSISNISGTSAMFHGTILDLGNPEITQHGACWNTSGNPSVLDNKTEKGSASSTGTFDSFIIGLMNSTTYYVRAYAINAAGTVYGDVMTFDSETFASTPPPYGDGSESDPYQIYTLENLKWLSESDSVWDKHFIQKDDIDAFPAQSWNSNTGWSPIGNISVKFTGLYDGNGFIIDNLFINRNDTNQGFFGICSSAVIQNLGLTGLDFTADRNVGGLIASIERTQVIRCYTQGEITAINSSFGYCGGLIFNISSTESYIAECYSNVNVSGISWVAGLIAMCNNNYVVNSYSYGNVSAPNNAFGLIASNGANVRNCFWDTQTSGRATSAGGTGKTTEEMKTESTYADAGWNFNDIWSINESINSGYPALETNVVQIPYTRTLAAQNIKANSADIQCRVIYLGDPAPSQHGLCWNTSGYPDINDNKTQEGSIDNTDIFVLSMSGLENATTYYVRSYAVNTYGTSYGDVISFTTAILDAVSPSAGDGNEGTPYQIASLANLYWISVNSGVWNKHFIQTSDINASATELLNSGTGWQPIGNTSINFTGSYDGNEYTIDSLYINRPSSGYPASYYIGLFGLLTGAEIHSINLTNARITGYSYVGGISGNIQNNGIINNCNCDGTIHGNDYTGGISGSVTYSQILNSGNHASVSGTSNSIGGITGYSNYSSSSNYSIISNCYNTGTISGSYYIGGLIGQNSNYCQANNCYNTGTVIGSTSYIGGLAGYNVSNITNSYNAGIVNGTATYTGGFLGYSSKTTSNCFWDTESSGQASSAGAAVGKTTVEMKTLATFTGAGWDFTDIWGMDAEINDGYPYLLWSYTPDVPLPINLVKFEGTFHNGAILLTWQTASETENAAFRIYRDGAMIAEIEGAGTTAEPHSYTFTDRFVIPGRTYSYQLADVSLDGEETKHPEIKVEVKVEGVDRDYSIGAAYPNPFNPLTVVPLNLAKDVPVRAVLYDVRGYVVKELINGDMPAGSHALKIDGSALSTGIYFVHVRVNDATHVQKIALMK